MLHHIALGARDVERVAAFYADLFELSEKTRHHYDDGSLRSVWLDIDSTILMVEHTEAPERRVEGVGAGPFLLAFAVADEAERRALEGRVEALGSPIEERTGFSSYFRDPEGNRVAVSHYPR
jgi:catechol 2,3-dioxygenase-like lactoylglutathione lyase family enzyme